MSREAREDLPLKKQLALEAALKEQAALIQQLMTKRVKPLEAHQRFS